MLRPPTLNLKGIKSIDNIVQSREHSIHLFMTNPRNINMRGVCNYDLLSLRKESNRLEHKLKAYYHIVYSFTLKNIKQKMELLIHLRICPTINQPYTLHGASVAVNCGIEEIVRI